MFELASLRMIYETAELMCVYPHGLGAGTLYINTL